MTRIYGKRTEVKGSAVNYFVSIQVDKLNQIEVRVTEEIFNALDELQSELWRFERKESRHCVHFESLKDCHIPHAYRAMSPEDACVEKETTGDLVEALLHISTK